MKTLQNNLTILQQLLDKHKFITKEILYLLKQSPNNGQEEK